MKKTLKEVVIYVLDTLQQQVTSVPLDWRHGGVMERFGVLVNLYTYAEGLNKGSDLYYKDKYGYYHPSADRLIPPSADE